MPTISCSCCVRKDLSYLSTSIMMQFIAAQFYIYVQYRKCRCGLIMAQQRCFQFFHAKTMCAVKFFKIQPASSAKLFQTPCLVCVDHIIQQHVLYADTCQSNQAMSANFVVPKSIIVFYFSKATQTHLNFEASSC